MKYFCILALIVLYGCSSQPIKLDESHLANRIHDSDMVNIFISSSEFLRIDPHFTIVGTRSPLFGTNAGYAVETGPLWKKVFIGASSNDPYIIIKSAALYDSVRAMGFAIQETYKIDAELNCHGHIYPIHAEGSRTSALAGYSAMKEAIEMGIIDAAKQSSMIVKIHTE